MICFIDRDGIINRDYGYVGTIERFEWQPGIFSLLSQLSALGYTLVMITNQSGIGRGYYDVADFYDLSFYIMNHLYDKYNIDIEINYCPHLPSDACKCRKPLAGMIRRYPISERDLFIGDQASDMQAAATAGVPRRWIVCEVPQGEFTAHFRTLEDVERALLKLPICEKETELPACGIPEADS